LPVALSIGVTIGVVPQTCGIIDHIFGELRENHKRNSVGGEMLAVENIIPEEFQGGLSLFILAGQSHLP
jgi:hypothetical protein